MNMLLEFAPTASLLFFFSVFMWVGFRAYRPSAKREMEQHALIPLKDNRHD